MGKTNSYWHTLANLTKRFTSGALSLAIAFSGLAAAAPLFFTQTASAIGPVTRYVNASGSDVGDCTAQTSPCATLQYTIDQANDGDTVQLSGNFTTTSQVIINKSITVDASGSTLSPGFSNFYGTDNNSALAIYADNVTVNGLVVEGSHGGNLHGINVWQATNVVLNNVTTENNARTGLTVNGSTVTVNNITTANNGYIWGGIDVDKAGAVLTVSGMSHHSEPYMSIYVDNMSAASVVDTNNQYIHHPSGFFGLTNDQIYNLKPLAPKAVLTAENFNTHNGPDYKGINVGFNVKDFGTVNFVTVDLYKGTTKLVTNTGTANLYALINGGEGQLSTPFYIQGGAADSYWTFGSHTWTADDKPTSAVVTVTGSNGSEQVTLSSLAEPNGWTFESLLPGPVYRASSTGGVEESFNTIQSALADSDTHDGDTIALDTDITTPSRVLITRPIVLAGNGHTISPTNSVTSSVIDIIGTHGVTLSNLTVDGANGFKLRGINVYESSAFLDSVTTKNNYKAGLVVNGSTVTVNNITTANNGWDGINVDQGTGVTSPATLTVNGTSTHNEFGNANDIYVDDTTKDVHIIDTNNQYFISHPNKDGTHSNDRAYNLDHSNLVVDVTYPTNNSVIRTPNHKLVVTGNFSATLNGANYIQTQLVYKGNDKGVITKYGTITNGTFAEFDTTNLPDGSEYYIAVTGTDTAGNVSTRKITNFTLDNTRPEITFVTPSAFNYATYNKYLQAGPSFTIKATDTNGITGTVLHIYNADGSHSSAWCSATTADTTSCDASTLANGNYYVKAGATDVANNNQTITKYFTVDNTNPTITVKDNYVGNENQKVFSNVSFSLYDQNQVDKYDINGHISDFTNNKWSDANFQNIKSYLHQGPNNTLTLYDVAGNSTAYVFTYDTVAPSGTFAYSNNNGNTVTADDVTVTLTTDEPVNTPNGWTNVTDKTFTRVYDQNGKYSVDIQDLAGNKSTLHYEVKRIDKVVPVINGVIDGHLYNSAVHYTITEQSISTLVVDGVSVTPGHVSGWDYTGPALSDDGPHTITVTDKAGNTATVSFTIDSTAPIAEITAPTATSGNLNGMVLIKGTVSDLNPDHYYFVVKDSNGKVVAGPGTVNKAVVADWNWDTTKVKDGVYTIDLEARDQAGNKDSRSTDTLKVTVYNNIPSVTAQDFGTGTWTKDHDGFTGINVGFLLGNFNSVNNITVDLYNADGIFVTNTASADMLDEINTNTNGFSLNGQVSSPFVVDGVLNDTYCGGSACWTTSNHTWTSKDLPVKAVITVYGVNDLGQAVTVPVENTSFTQTVGASFTSLLPAAKNTAKASVTATPQSLQGNTSGTQGSTTQNQTFAAGSVASAAVDSATSSVLGAEGQSDTLSGSTDDNGTKEIKNAKATTCTKLLGICWYYWVPLVVVVGYIIYRYFRSADENQASSGRR